MATALEKRYLKSKIVTRLENLGYSVSATDSADIAVFTDRPINNKSIKAHNARNPYITSFGVKGALKFISE
jgi:tRNA G26 N,N-dimethylase Trm1